MLRVGDLRELQAATLAMKAADRDLRSTINRATRETMNPVWRGLVAQNATTAADRRVLARGARIAAGNPPTAIAASSSRPLSGGLRPSEQWPAFEFGATARNKTTTYTRRNRSGSGSHRVTRHTARQLPRRASSGRVVFPAMGEIGPRLASLWVQLIVRTYYEASEGR